MSSSTSRSKGSAKSKGRPRPAREWVSLLVRGGLLAGIALSPKLWFPLHRLYPTAPAANWLGIGPAWIDALLSIAMIAALLAGERFWRVALVALALLVLRDQSRLQPWVWEYALLLIGVMSPGLKTCRSILIALYLWSGIQKLNVTFATRTWADVTSGHLPASMWILIPLGEMAIALALLWPRTRRVAMFAAIALHLSILVSLVASHENSVVWPWNIAMAALVFVLFRLDSGQQTADSRKSGLPLSAVRVPLSGMEFALVAVAGVLPILSLFNCWDAYLSGALYSGNTEQAVVIVSPGVIAHLPDVIARNTWQESAPRFIDLNRWSFDELNVPAYPADRVFKAVGAEVCATYADNGTLEILGRPNALDGARTSTTIPCIDLAFQARGLASPALRNRHLASAAESFR